LQTLVPKYLLNQSSETRVTRRTG